MPPHRAHSARHGARAAADLLGLYLRMTGEPPPWSLRVDEWAALPPCTDLPVQRRRPEERERHFLTRLLDRLPRSADPRGDSYLDRLDRALADRHISGTVTWCITGATSSPREDRQRDAAAPGSRSART
jgi:DNA polymerase-3 subunit epsilon